jgi:hypothetical protein
LFAGVVLAAATSPQAAADDSLSNLAERYAEGKLSVRWEPPGGLDEELRKHLNSAAYSVERVLGEAGFVVIKAADQPVDLLLKGSIATGEADYGFALDFGGLASPAPTFEGGLHIETASGKRLWEVRLRGEPGKDYRPQISSDFTDRHAALKMKLKERSGWEFSESVRKHPPPAASLLRALVEGNSQRLSSLIARRYQAQQANAIDVERLGTSYASFIPCRGCPTLLAVGLRKRCLVVDSPDTVRVIDNAPAELAEAAVTPDGRYLALLRSGSEPYSEGSLYHKTFRDLVLYDLQSGAKLTEARTPFSNGRLAIDAGAAHGVFLGSLESDYKTKVLYHIDLRSGAATAAQAPPEMAREHYDVYPVLMHVPEAGGDSVLLAFWSRARFEEGSWKDVTCGRFDFRQGKWRWQQQFRAPDWEVGLSADGKTLHLWWPEAIAHFDVEQGTRTFFELDGRDPTGTSHRALSPSGTSMALVRDRRLRVYDFRARQESELAETPDGLFHLHFDHLGRQVLVSASWGGVLAYDLASPPAARQQP